MEARVQYNDYLGTTAADCSDVFIELPGQMCSIVVEQFGIPLAAVDYYFVGVAITGTQVDNVLARFYFRNIKTRQVVKYYKHDVNLQRVLDLFKRFEFQIGEQLEDINEMEVEEIEEIEE